MRRADATSLKFGSVRRVPGLRRPVAVLMIAGLGLGAVALPALSLELGLPEGGFLVSTQLPLPPAKDTPRGTDGAPTAKGPMADAATGGAETGDAP